MSNSLDNEGNSIQQGLDEQKSNFRRLMDFYKGLLEILEISDCHEERNKKATIWQLLHLLTEQELERKVKYLEREGLEHALKCVLDCDGDIERSPEIEDYDEFEEQLFKLHKMASAMVEVIDATSDEVDGLNIYWTNGNNYLYFDNDRSTLYYDGQIEERLSTIGEHTKGNTWFMYYSKKGEWVIY